MVDNSLDSSTMSDTPENSKTVSSSLLGHNDDESSIDRGEVSALAAAARRNMTFKSSSENEAYSRDEALIEETMRSISLLEPIQNDENYESKECRVSNY